MLITFTYVSADDQVDSLSEIQFDPKGVFLCLWKYDKESDVRWKRDEKREIR